MVAVVSGADVLVGGEVVGVNAAAVNVNCETTVLAADVRTAPISEVGSAVVASGDAHATINMATRAVITIDLSFI